MPIRIRSFIYKCTNSFHVLSWDKACLALKLQRLLSWAEQRVCSPNDIFDFSTYCPLPSSPKVLTSPEFMEDRHFVAFKASFPRKEAT